MTALDSLRLDAPDPEEDQLMTITPETIADDLADELGLA